VSHVRGCIGPSGSRRSIAIGEIMFIIARRGTRLKRSFFVWSFVMLSGALGLTMHVYLDPTEKK
jgi:hypothetical protein